MKFTRLLAMARKEAIQLRRDSRSLILAFLLPVVLLIIFGYAISWDVKNIKTAVLDQDNSQQSRELLDAFRASGYFTFTRRLNATSEIGPLLDGVSTQLVLVIPPDFSAHLNAGRAAELQAIVDGSDANTATIILAYARAIVRTDSLKVQLQGRQLTLPVRAETRIWFNEELVSRNMIVPGLVAMIMMIVAAMLTATTIAREWERGTMEQLAGKFGIDPYNKNAITAFPELAMNVTVGWTRDNWGATALFRWFDETKDGFDGSECGNVCVAKDVLYLDMQAYYDWDNMRFTIGARNLTDEDPPYVTNYDDMNTLHYTYNTSGQYWYGRWQMKF